MRRIINLIITILIFASIACAIYKVKGTENNKTEKSYYRLLIKGDNITYKNEPFVENDTAYIPLDTINKLFEDYLVYDESSDKIVYTDYTTVAKYKIGSENKVVNFKEEKTKYPMLKKDGVVYIPVAEFSKYDLDIRFNVDNKMIALDDPKADKYKVKQDNVYVYTDMDLTSKVVAKLKYDDVIHVYEDKLNHSRWNKVSTADGSFGYMSKVPFEKQVQDLSGQIVDESKNPINEEKVVMFWQQGNSLSILGDKVEGVNTVSPDWFDIINSDGEFKDKVSKEYLDKAKSYGYEVWPMFSNVNSEKPQTIVSEIMNSEAKREKTIKSILKIVDKYDLDGVNLDFEMMKAEDKGLFTQFVRELAPLLREKGKKLSVDIYFVNYIERSKIGKAADYVVLMAYDQHWNGSKVAGSVAELSWVENNVKSLLNDSDIEPNKIILGVPFYSKLWKEVNGGSPTASNVSLGNAQDFISTNGIKTVVDKKSGQNYGEMSFGNITYKIWIEDSFSMKKRAELVKKYNLAGISAWQKFFDTPDIWESITKNIK